MSNYLYGNVHQWSNVLPAFVGEFAITAKGFYFFPQSSLVDPLHEQYKPAIAAQERSAEIAFAEILGTEVKVGSVRIKGSPASPARMVPTTELAPSVLSAATCEPGDVDALELHLASLLQSRQAQASDSAPGIAPMTPHITRRHDVTRVKLVGPTEHTSGYKAVFLHLVTPDAEYRYAFVPSLKESLIETLASLGYDFVTSNPLW